MKYILVLSLVFSFAFIQAQGLKLMPVENYNKLKSPPQLAGNSTAKTAGLPASYVIPVNFFPTPGNQGGQPSCTAWATGYGFMSFYQACKASREVKTESHIYSPSYIYQNIKELSCPDCSCGTYISDALNFLKNTGNVSITDCPYNSSDCSKPNSKLATIASNYKIKDWYRVEDVKNFNELKTFLSKDMPVIIAVYTDDVFSGFYNKTENDIYKRTPSDDKDGLHAILLVGYDNSKHAFKILNSYGKTWGANGYAWIDYDSFKAMIAEGYVVQKDYTLPKINPNVNPVVDPDLVVDNKDTEVKEEEYYSEVDEIVQQYDNRVENETISEENFAIYAYSEEIREGRNYYTCGFDISDGVVNLVSKIVYVYDDPSFSENYVEVLEGPNFYTSYEGWGCYENMQAIVFFKNNTSMTFEFNACELIEYYNSSEEEYALESFEITPVVTAKETPREGMYNFQVQLRGIESIKDHIVEVVYDRNHESIKQRYYTTTDKTNNFQGGYTGWGCLEDLVVTIYYDDETFDTYTINMCNELGW
jgi:hypothetical protein